jgi:hypothetical protein
MHKCGFVVYGKGVGKMINPCPSLQKRAKMMVIKRKASIGMRKSGPRMIATMRASE